MLARPKFDVILSRSNSSREQMLAHMRMLAEVIDAPPLAKPVCRDPDDDAVLALALASQADVIISGDDDLLVLSSFEGIPILNPAMALQQVMNSS
ncbi:MAG: putative toxin-antitoxin system toxin component, PIN family [Brachymonas sp.]|nr:putative toxin-antitoxin system toxin component, PIN family [Brachymonas sp.]